MKRVRERLKENHLREGRCADESARISKQRGYMRDGEERQRLSSWHTVTVPPPRRLCFLTQRAETIENKRVVFFVSAKKCRRVWKQQEVKEIDEAKEIKE